MSHWNSAIEAFDEELGVLEELREEYRQFLGGTLRRLAEIRTAVAEDGWTSSVAGDGLRVYWIGRPREDSPVSLQAWALAPWGGRAATFAVGVVLDESGFPADARTQRRKLMVAAAEKDFDSVPGGLPMRSEHGDVTPAVVRIATASMKEQPADRLAELLEALAPFAERLDGIIRLNRWLADSLQSVLTAKALPAGVPEAAEWHRPTLGAWQAGHYIQLDQKAPPRCVWVSTRPPADLVIAHQTRQLHKSLLQAVRAADYPLSSTSAKAGLLMDSAYVAELHAHGDVTAVQTRVAEAFAAYFRVADDA